MGVTAVGVEKLVGLLESKTVKKTSVLSAVDVSGDDGAPEITKKLQRRLTACLTRNAEKEMDRSRKKKLRKLANLEVYECHSEE
jgi:hypothetical protein